MTNKMQKLGEALQQRFGFVFLCETRTEDGYPVVLIRLADLKPPHGFSIKVKLSWKSLGIRFIQDSFSKHLVQDMGLPDISKRTVATSFVTALKQYGGSLDFKINGAEINPQDMQCWPEDWTTLDISYDRLGVEPDLEQFLNGGSDIFQQFLDYLGIIVSLLPVEKDSYEEPLEGLPEGMLVREEVNRYERNRLNREACIAINGMTCQVCGFNFKETFGELGDGFIHIHHVIPVSQLGANHIVNPSRDLVPVCANCHSMMHRKDPPLTVEELKDLIIFYGKG